MEKYKRMTLQERVTISNLLACGKSKADIAGQLCRDRSSISREINPWGKKYDPLRAQRYADLGAGMRNNKRKLDAVPGLLEYIREKLSLKWSPEQISNKIAGDFPDNEQMRVSHETIYTYIYLLARGTLKKELIENLKASPSPLRSKLEI